MRFVWVLNGRKIKRTLFIIVAAFFAALVAFVQNQEVSVFSTTKGPKALSQVKTDQDQLSLTFDISWGDVQVEPILKTLKREKVKATFFISGEWAERHKDIVEKIVKDGHEIASHGYRHQSYTGMEPNEIRKDIQLANQAIKKAIGKKPNLLRPPFGKINKDVLQTVSRLDQQVVLWSVNPQDAENPGSESIASYVVEHSDKGDIIRMHASDSAKQTFKALPFIIEELKHKDFTFVTLSSLISDAKVNSKIIK
ncbi:polysaccharide deacetylase family sporulation protein PdaB [Scopulibacillus darangshiensis]|uniref:Polysaccharide deacetylase family sporulation protein PdaB n=1 Tax=Scopulibacillus darangshiensis TaxID=442528 RepID=A0A4R2NR71_9BACL|nr:polysaccharide deacetylase family sporulation protein PdaB [Scopulibacillus darangshiensis]TCP24202.1 polysaccharide deacetylase family sporulation protein PdaB [Scopulibacillus darangshiensis]